METSTVRQTAVSKRLKGKMYGLFLFVPCHRKPERCLCVNGKAMPICARCLFMLVGMLTVPFFMFSPLPFWLGILLQAPMIVDGWTQMKGWRISNNALRIATGLTSGMGLAIGITGLFWLIAGWMNAF